MAGGRPTKLTAEVTQLVCEGIAIGLDYNEACMDAGIGYSTYNLWEKSGDTARQKQQQGEPLTAADRRYLEFLEAIELAKVRGTRRRLERLDRHGEKDFRADVWWLENVAGKKARNVTEHVGKDNGPIQQEVKADVTTQLAVDPAGLAAIVEAARSIVGRTSNSRAGDASNGGVGAADDSQ